MDSENPLVGSMDPQDALLLAPAIAQGDKKALMTGLAKFLGGARAESVVAALLDWKNSNDKSFEQFLNELEREQDEAAQARLVGRVVVDALAGDLETIHRAAEQTQESLDAISVLTRKAQLASEENSSKLNRLVESDETRTGAGIHHSLDRLNLQLGKNRPTEVIEELNVLRMRVWHSAAPDVRARIVGMQGIATLHMGEEKKGAELLIKARVEDPTGLRSLQHAALGYSILGDNPKALELSCQVLERDPRNPTALQVKILADPREDNTAIEAELEKKSLLVPEAHFALGQRAYRSRQLADAQRHFHLAREGDPDCANYEAMCAIVDIECIATATPTRTERTVLLERSRILERLWSALAEEGVKRARVGWLHALTLAEHLCNSPNALPHSAALLTYQPDNATYIQLRAAILAIEGQPTAALTLLDQLGPGESEEVGLRAAVLAKSGRLVEALRTWEELFASDRGASEQDRENYCAALVRVGRANEALDFARRWRDVARTAPRALLLLERCAKETDSTSLLGEAIDAISGLSPEHLSVQDLVSCAGVLADHERHRLAANFYGKAISRDGSESIAFRYAKALLRAGLFEDLFRFLEREQKQHPSLVEFAVAANERLGNLHQARRSCEDHLASIPDDVRIRLRYCAILCRANEEVALREQLERIDLHGHDWSPEESQNLSALLASADRQIDALEVQLRYMEQHVQVDAYARYFSAYFRWRSHVGVKEIVDDDCSVRLEGTGAPVWIRIVRDPARVSAMPNTFTADQDLAKALIGKTVGDQVTSAGVPDRPWRVVEVSNAYAFAADYVRRHFSSLFPLSGEIQQYDVDESIGNFVELTERKLRKQQEYADNVHLVYARGTIPLSVLGRALHRGPVETIGAALGSSSGLLAHPLAESNRPLTYDPQRELVVDLSGLACLSILVGLPLSQALADAKVVVAQSTIDELCRWRDETASGRGEKLSLGLHEGRFAAFRESPEEREARLAFADAQLSWVRSNAEVRGVSPATAQRWHEHQEHAAQFAGCFLDSYLLAADEQLIVSDDFALRRYAAPVLGVQAVSSMAWIIDLNQRGKLSDDDLSVRSLRLLAAGYRQVPVSAGLLWYARNSGEVNLFRAALRGLEGPDVTAESAVAVAVRYLKREALEPSEVQGESVRFDLLARSLISGRDARRVLRSLVAALDVAFAMLPVHHARLAGLLRTWTRANQLLL